MRSRFPLAVRIPLAALAVSGALGRAGTPAAWAQATVEPRALDQLAPPPAQSPATPPPAPGKPVPRKPVASKPAAAKPGAAATPAKPAAIIVPAAPPPPPVLPPPFAVPIRPAPPPPPTPITADAPDVASRTRNGLRITFGGGRADLNPESAAAIADLVHAATTPDSSYTVTAYATGGDDPSLPRRMSLSRALAARGALMDAGVASVRIYVKALGASSPAIADGPPDRVDIAVTPGQMPAVTTPAPTQQPAPTQPAPIQKAAP